MFSGRALDGAAILRQMNTVSIENPSCLADTEAAALAVNKCMIGAAKNGGIMSEKCMVIYEGRND